MNPCFSTNNPCMNGGGCIYGIQNGPPEAAVPVCSCSSPWTGDTCEISCTIDPCNGNGACNVQNGVISCTCFAGFLGSFCNIDDPCLPEPCMNACICIVTSSFTAFCSTTNPYVTGQFCETVHPCIDAQLCQNDGTCNQIGATQMTRVCQ
eukprot:XP_011674088.1 PREDICTED: fibropellin-1 [Strongylocentrotus purpuratus]